MNRILCTIYFGAAMAEVAGSFFLCARGRKCHKTYMFLGCLLMSALWCLSQTCIYISNNIAQMWISYTIGNFAICFIGSFWLLFCSTFLKETIPLKNSIIFLISIVLYMIVISNQSHHLYYKQFKINQLQYGIAFYINVVFNYFCIIVGILILLICAKRKQNYKKVNKLLVVCASIPLLLNFFYQMKLLEISFDITPLGFCFSYLLVLTATFRYDFLNVNQLAFERVLQEIQEGIIVFQLDGKCSFKNRELCKMLGTECVESIEDFCGLLEEDEVEELNNNGEVLMQRKDKYYHLQKTIYYRKKKEAAEGYSVKDVSKYYQLMEQSKKISDLEKELALEKQRKKMLQQVHDTMGHTLTMIQSYLKLTEASLKKTETFETVEQYLKQADILVKQGIRELTEYMTREQLGQRDELLTQRLLKLVNTVKEIPIEVSVIGEENDKYSLLVETAFICVRECITNTLKYADANKIQIIIKFSENFLEIHIFDDGKGCEEVKYGMGLQGIYERISKKQGTLKVCSSINEGFQVVIKLPLSP